MEIASDFKSAATVEQRAMDELGRFGYSKVATFAIKLALEEGLSNAIRHGNDCDNKKRIEVLLDITKDRAAITISDHGDGFNPDDVPDPTIDENLEKPYGRGIMLMRAYMDTVQYNDRGNQLHMVKQNC